MEYVSTKNAPGAIGPYSQAVKANGLLFTSGQIAINPETNTVEAKTIEEQTHQVCKNLKAVVEAAGTAFGVEGLLYKERTDSVLFRIDRHQTTF